MCHTCRRGNSNNRETRIRLDTAQLGANTQHRLRPFRETSKQKKQTSTHTHAAYTNTDTATATHSHTRIQHSHTRIQTDTATATATHEHRHMCWHMHRHRHRHRHADTDIQSQLTAFAICTGLERVQERANSVTTSHFGRTIHRVQTKVGEHGIHVVRLHSVCQRCQRTLKLRTLHLQNNAHNTAV